MMNEEEIIKSKLNTYRPEYNAADWAAMEKLLDGKKDKKPIILWWKYGLAVGLFLIASIGGVAVYEASKNQNSIAQENTKNSTSTQKSISNKTSKQQVALDETAVVSSNNNTPSLDNSLTSKASKQQAVSNAPHSNSTGSAKSANAKQPISILANIATQLQSSLNLLSPKENEVIAASSRRELIDYHMALAEAINNELSENLMYQKKEEFVSSRSNRKKIPIEYSIALQGSGLLNLSLKNNKVNLFLDQFSDVSLVGQMMIGKHVGAYVGIGYADRVAGVKSDSAKYDNLVYSKLNVLRDKSEGLNIPIGVTLNIYNDAYLNVYSKVGLNNIILLKQHTKVEYTTDPNTPLAASNLQRVGNAVISSSADFAAPSMNFEESSNVLTDNIAVKTYTTTPAEKYLPEFNLAFGIKANMTKNLGFVFEPSYRIDFRSKHREVVSHNLALSGALVYTF